MNKREYRTIHKALNMMDRRFHGLDIAFWEHSQGANFRSVCYAWKAWLKYRKMSNPHNKIYFWSAKW